LHLRSDDIDGALSRWRVDLDRDAGLASLLFESSFKAYLGGQLFVRSIELAGESGPGVVALSATRREGSSYLSLPFDEAVAFFASKRVMSPAEFDAIEDRFREGGFVARGLASERTVEVARDLIERLLSQGLTLADVRAQLTTADTEAASSLGISPAFPWYLDTVVRTNIATAYGAGRWQAMNDPNVVALRPFTQVRTSGDSRVRASHRLLDGKVFRLGSDLAAYYARPGGFNCRCTNVTLSQRQMDARGLTETTERIVGADPDPGWEGEPAPLE
jgi:SPP1 gp7 family putative phage head morphogenesis protein